MANKARSLGNAGEAGIVKRALSWGIKALRQPGSGQFKDYPADLTLEIGQVKVLGESKVRALKVTPSGKTTWTIDFDWLRKVMREGAENGFHHAALFVRPKGSQDRFVLLDEGVYFVLLRNAYRDRS